MRKEKKGQMEVKWDYYIRDVKNKLGGRDGSGEGEERVMK